MLMSLVSAVVFFAVLSQVFFPNQGSTAALLHAKAGALLAYVVRQVMVFGLLAGVFASVMLMLFTMDVPELTWLFLSAMSIASISAGAAQTVVVLVMMNRVLRLHNNV